jgi:signal transduction histidine kinase
LNEQKTLAQRYQAMSKELLIAKEKAEEMNRLKDSFLANMSHEIRTPINGILGLSQIIEEETADPVTKEYTTLLKKSGTRLLHTMTSILEMAKLESEKLDFKLSPLRVDGLIQETIASLETMIAEKGIAVTYTSGKVPWVCQGDEILVQQVFRHIIENAVKFTEKGEIKVETATYHSEQQYISIKVTDTGIGIAEEFLSRLFQPFVQESSGQSRQFEGIGLGLFIAKKYVEMMGGDILVNSKKGEGSSFQILLLQYI